MSLILQQTEAEEIRKLALRLRRSNPIRQIAFTLLQGNPEEIVNIQPLRDVLAERSEGRWRERMLAAWALGRAPMTDKQKEEAAQLLCRVASNRQMGAGERTLKRLGRAMWRTGLFSLFPIFSYWFSILIQNHEWHTMVVNPQQVGMWSALFAVVSIVLFWIFLLFPVGSLSVDWDRNTLVRKYAIRSLGPLGRPSSFRTLVHLCEAFDTYLQLEEVLSQLPPECYSEYSDMTTSLCRLLNRMYSYTDEKHFLVVLRALEKVGSGQAVRPVERRTKFVPTKVCEEAMRILPILQERQRRENDPRLLLRSADSPIAVDTLLRPAGGGTSEPQTLLRAVLTVESPEADREP